MHVAYNYLTNRQTGDTADANGNIGAGYNYDMENRLVQPGSSSTARYAYDAANKRVWRGDTGVDEITFWAGQKLATYQISTTSGLYFTLTSTNVYFGSKLISKGTYNSSGTGDKVSLTPVAADRLGSIGKFYPYGVERPSATGNDKEKFTGYFRDASTGLDYADQRYEQPGMGRFMTPDFAPSSKLNDPGSWNKYAYTRGDPINRIDPTGMDDEGPPVYPLEVVMSFPYMTAWGNWGLPITIPDIASLIKSGVRQAENNVIKGAVTNAANSLLTEDCASLFLAPDQNTAENRQGLADALNSAETNGNIMLMSSDLQAASGSNPNVGNPNVPAYTSDGAIWILEGRTFFTNQTGSGQALGGAFTGLALAGTQQLILLHEFLHLQGVVGEDAANQTIKLPNGDVVTGSNGVSIDVRDKCFK